MIIGVLAIQGDFAAHIRMLRHVGVDAVEIRRSSDLVSLDGLILPGGESTTMLKFIEGEGLNEPITDFARPGKPIFGTCAGAILLARDVYNPSQPSLGLIDIGVERNGYGRQVDSFVADIEPALEGGLLEAVFIRAPKIKRAGPDVEVLGSLNGEPVLVRERNILAATFHPELTEDTRVHRMFADMVIQSAGN
ncbi:MAG TPA: pyridoxal 5'-phosphate synthase glutaminase subunit PdxT [Blastocatellia bacterium]|nr:pyridoxal 5'-phosphate synthase glutaminase subunit PdxT [Blastocatellia bacterium]